MRTTTIDHKLRSTRIFRVKHRWVIDDRYEIGSLYEQHEICCRNILDIVDRIVLSNDHLNVSALGQTLQGVPLNGNGVIVQEVVPKLPANRWAAPN